MTDPVFGSTELVRAIHEERLTNAERLRAVRRLRPDRRHAIARALHRFADRLDL